MCHFFGISRAAYYKWVKRFLEPDPDQERMQLVKEVWLKSRKTYGYRRVTISLQNQGHTINHKAVLRLMQKLKIRSVARKRKPYKKTSQMENHHRYQNVLARDFMATAPNQKWVTDISYVLTQQGWAYLSTIKDLFDGFIVAHQVGRANNIALVTNTLKLAIQHEKITKKLLLHSDQGFQYTSHPYFVLTSTNNIQPSMSRRGNCWDNAPMESFFGHFKEEALRQYPTPTFQQAQKIVDAYIAFYNYERIQLKTKQTPYQTRCLSK
jgi:transposase InsO family protein